MRKGMVLVFAMLAVFAVASYAEAEEFYVYKDKSSADNHFIPSGWMGDYGDLKISDQCTTESHSGTTSIEVTYSAKKSQGNGWGGVYWQSAENNWGTKDSGYDLSDFNKLVFMAKGKKGGEIITTIKVGGIIRGANDETVEFADTTSVEYGPVRLTKEWQEYSINLANKDLSYVNGGFSLILNADQAGGHQTFYIDDIHYAFEEDLERADSGVNFPFYVYADINSLDNHFIPSGWMPATAARDIRMDTAWKNEPFSGETCIKAGYKNTSGTRWAGIYWQQPANNWGSIPNAGFNLQGATKVTFWAKGEKGNELVNEFKVGGIVSGEFIDSDSVSIGPIQLTKEWKQYEMDLRGRDLSYVIGGFGWATNIDVNDPEGITFFIDEIKYENE
ncbi:MAG: hypothetical protein GY858_07675 [Candidatus Omnitrophica bacterium]|nr:hypothetical protein [Candidatus Omnitrophota bacterium]